VGGWSFDEVWWLLDMLFGVDRTNVREELRRRVEA